MIDIKLFHDEKFGTYDLKTTGEDIEEENGLETAIIISLYTDRRVENKNGFWGDSLGDGEWGSKIWTLRRETLNPKIQKKLEEYAKDSLKWLIDDKVAKSITVSSEIINPMSIHLLIKIIRPNGSVLGYRFNNIWGE